MLNRNLAIEHGRVEAALAGRQHHHEICVCRKLEDKQAEAGAGLVLHAGKLLGVAGRAREARDALLEVLHDVGHALEAVLGRIARRLLGGPRRDGQERGALEEQDLLGLDGDAEVGEVALDDGEVGDEVVDDARPGLVQALVPDGRGKGRDVNLVGVAVDGVDVLEGALADDADAVVVDGLARGRHDKVHLVHEDVDLGAGRVLQQGGEDGDVGGEVAVDVA